MASADQTIGRLLPAIAPVHLVQKLLDVEWLALSFVERAEACIDVGAKCPQFLDMGDQLSCDLLLIGIGQGLDLGDGFLQRFDHIPSIASDMDSSSTSKWIAAAGAALLAFAMADSLVPTTLQVRLGLHWLIEHFLAYFAVALLFCLAWQRPVVAAAILMLVAAAMEALQGLTSDRIPDLATGFCGAAGALAGALTASLVTDLWQTRRRRPEAPFS